MDDNEQTGVDDPAASDSATDSGGDTGGADAGGADAGSTDTTTDSGGGSGTDAGGDSGTTDSSETDTGATDATGAADTGGDTGSTDDGGGGGADAGGTDDAAATGTQGGDTGGTDTATADSGLDAASSDGGTTDAGATDAGDSSGSDVATADSGGADGGGSDGNDGGGTAGTDAGGTNAATATGTPTGPTTGGSTAASTKPARQMTKAEAMAELNRLQTANQIKFAASTVLAGHVDLDGLVPGTTTAQAGNVVGVIVRYWASGTKTGTPPSGGNAPDVQDPRAAVALIRLCEWLKSTWGVTELYHAGVNGSTGRTDCHGQGRALDFVGVKGNHGGTDFLLTVYDDWGRVSTTHTPGGTWTPAGTDKTHFRLDDVTPRPMAADFFQAFYDFAAGQYQDKSSNPDPPTTPTKIGDRTFMMNPDHPTSKPGTPNGREAHQGHVHVQIGVTGTEP